MDNIEKKVSGNECLAEFLRVVGQGNEHGIEVVRQLDPDGKNDTKLTMVNRKLLPEQPREYDKARSPKRAHVFYEVKGFIEYVQREGVNGQIVVLADAGKSLITAILNDRNQKGGFEVIRLQPQIHPLFKPWYLLLSSAGKISLPEFVRFILKYKRSVVTPEPTELLTSFSQLRASRKSEIAEGVGKNSLNGVMVRTKIQGTEHDVEVDLPDVIRIKVPLFMGLPEQGLDIDFLLGVNSQDSIFIEAVSADVDKAIIDSFEQMIDQCRVIEGAVVALGSNVVDDWDVVKESNCANL